jgi:hypothetical protein
MMPAARNQPAPSRPKKDSSLEVSIAVVSPAPAVAVSSGKKLLLS